MTDEQHPDAKRDRNDWKTQWRNWLDIGALLASGLQKSRATAGIVASNRNAGPVLLIAADSFADVEGPIPAIISVCIVLLVTGVVLASWLGKETAAAETAEVSP